MHESVSLHLYYCMNDVPVCLMTIKAILLQHPALFWNAETKRCWMRDFWKFRIRNHPKAGMFFCTTTGVLNLGDEERTIQKTNEQTNKETRRQRRTTNNKRHEGRFQTKRSTWTFMTFGVVRHSKKRMAETWKGSLLRGKSFEANLPCFWGFQGFCWVDEHSISMSFISCYLWGLWELQGLKPPMVQIGSQKNPEKNNSKNPS